MNPNKIQRRSATAECRPKGAIDSRPKMPSYPRIIEEILQQQWTLAKPKWFITLQWTPAAINYEIASGHSRLFRNKLLTTIYECHLKQLPDAKDRCRLFWFHERALDPKGHLIYHSHLHLTQLPQTYSTQRQLELLVQHKIAPGFRCLKNLYRKQDPSVAIKPWKQKQHANYNLKDYYTYKHQQDPDLVLDPLISDLIFAK